MFIKLTKNGLYFDDFLHQGAYCSNFFDFYEYFYNYLIASKLRKLNHPLS